MRDATAIPLIDAGFTPPTRITPPKPALRGLPWLQAHWLTIFISIILFWIIGIPLVSLIIYSFRLGTPVNPGRFSIQHYVDAYSSPQTWPVLLNTFAYAVSVSALSLTTATVFTWLVERTNMPGRRIAWVIMLMPLAMPGILSSMGWILLLSPKTGVINIGLRGLLSLIGIDITTGPLNIYSLWGMIFVEGVKGGTTLFLMLIAAFRLMDPSLDEAALASGAAGSYTFRKVTIPLMVPALLAAGMYAVISNLDDLETPLLIGVPAGVLVFPTLIYFTASGSSNWGLASAYSTIFLLITLVMVIIYYRAVLRRVERFAVITGKGYRPRQVQLGKWRYPALGLFIAYFSLTLAFPIGVLLWASLLPSYRPPSRAAIHNLTLDNYRTLFEDPRIIEAVRNTGQLALATATTTMVLAFVVAWLVVRGKARSRVALDAMVFVAFAMPTITMTVALVAFYLHPWIRWTQIFGTAAIMVLAMTARYITFASRTANTAISQINLELEEAAYVSGVGKMTTLARITFRLLSPAFIAGGIWVAAHAIKNLTIPLMLSSPGSETLASHLYRSWNDRADFPAAAALGIGMMAVLTLVAIAARRLIASGYSEGD